MMKSILLIILMILTCSIQYIAAQQFEGEPPEYFLKRYTSEEEMNTPFTPESRGETSIPSGSVRMVAEFEPMQAVLIRYPFGVPFSLIAEMAQDIEVVTIVRNNTQLNTVLSQYNSNGVNTENCSFLIANSDSYWTRDYGPWFVFDGNNQPGITDFPYNRPRPADNAIPSQMANYLGIDYYYMNVVHTGGNLMVDGLGTAASTDLVYEENTSIGITQVHQRMEDYLGVTDYDVTIDPLGDYIKHIDTWAKYLAPDKIMIGQVPASDPRYDDFEAVANYFANRVTPWGYPYRVYRVYTPGGNPATPYTNSLILNNKVFVPLTGSMWDSQALSAYEAAMPGYQIIGIPWGNNWYNTDALHCRTREIADLGMLFVDHRPHFGELDMQDSIPVSAKIIPYSGENLYSDSLFVYYSINGDEFQQDVLIETGENFTGYIKNYQFGDTLQYYLFAADESGRNIKHPYMGDLDPHWFVIEPEVFTDVVISPDTLIFNENIFEQFEIHNPTTESVTIISIDNLSENAAVQILSPELPYVLESGDTLTVDAELIQPVMATYDPSSEYFEELISIVSNLSEKQLVVLIDKSLITGLSTPVEHSRISVFPNPFNNQVSFEINLESESHVTIEIFSLLGSRISSVYDDNLPQGRHLLSWNSIGNDGIELCKGIYLYRIRLKDKTIEGKLIKF